MQGTKIRTHYFQSFNVLISSQLFAKTFNQVVCNRRSGQLNKYYTNTEPIWEHP